VKRVVTVKQARPFRLAGPGHGYAMYAGARRPGGAKAYASAPKQRSGEGGRMQRQEGSILGSGSNAL
jgi:hypothetical protein